MDGRCGFLDFILGCLQMFTRPGKHTKSYWSHGPVEIVDLASYNMVDLSSSLCDSLPEGILFIHVYICSHMFIYDVKIYMLVYWSTWDDIPTWQSYGANDDIDETRYPFMGLGHKKKHQWQLPWSRIPRHFPAFSTGLGLRIFTDGLSNHLYIICNAYILLYYYIISYYIISMFKKTSLNITKL